MVYRGNLFTKPNVPSDDQIIPVNSPVPYCKVDTRILHPLSTYNKQNPIMCIREIGMGMRNVLENLLEIVKKHKSSKRNMTSISTMSSFIHNKRNASIETFLSVVTIPTQTFTSQFQLIPKEFRHPVALRSIEAPVNEENKKKKYEEEKKKKDYDQEYILNLLRSTNYNSKRLN